MPEKNHGLLENLTRINPIQKLYLLKNKLNNLIMLCSLISRKN